jgi:hypothetical protein
MLLEEKEFKKAFKSVIATKEGQQLLSHYISYCGCDDYLRLSNNQREDDFDAGKKFIGGNILENFKRYNLKGYCAVLEKEQEKLAENERNDEE